MLQNPTFVMVKPYVLNYLRKNYWRVERLMSFEDAVGEAQLQFWRTIDRLTKRGCVIENEKHLMSLFKTSWSRHFTTLSNKNSHEVVVCDMKDVEFSFIEETVVGDRDNDGYIQCLFASAPSEIRQVVLLMLKLPTETVDVIVSLVERDLLDAANAMVCRLLGKSTQQQVLKNTLEYFKS